MTAPTKTCIVSPIPRNTSTSCVRVADSTRVSASENRIVNSTSCMSAPFAAAAIGLVGSRELTHAPTDCTGPAFAISLVTSAAPGGSAGCTPPLDGSAPNAIGASGTAIAATKVRSPKNTSSVRRPTVPRLCMSPAEPSPVMISDTTSGMTVMRMAFTQREPIGARKSTAASSWGFPSALTPMPRSIANTRASRTRDVDFIVTS